jgi:phenylalanyl-tRNA synthetase beta chain
VIASLNWLSALLGQPLDPDDTARRLTMLGATVDAVEPIHHDLRDLVIGLVEQVEPHPNADRLSVCQVQAGAAPVEVVCGAPNVRAGAKYPFAPVGATLPGGLTLDRRKIRGVLSNGMLCSARELGLGAEHLGILELETAAAPGTPLLEALPLADTQLTLDITPNRPDLLSQRGVARELAAHLGATLRLPSFPGTPTVLAPRRAGASGTVGGIEAVIEDVEGCPRYIAAVIRGVRVGPSPDWLQTRLRSIGARPINNVVDATNYALHEINQPMHAFDLAKLRDGRLIIRRARPGERLTTLDGENRALTDAMTMICDGKGPIAVAGVMGGANSEVTAATTDVLLECACFAPAHVRLARVTLGMSTDASYRFERGTDLLGLATSVRRAIELIIAVAGGAEAEPALDLWPEPAQPRTVFLRPDRVAHLLGVEVPRAQIETLLSGVGFTVAPKDDRLAVQVPGWRPDVTREVDLIEEVARLRGYETFPVELRPYRPTLVPSAPSERVAAAVRRLLTGLGCHEARTLPMGAQGGEDAPVLVNPLSSEESHLRTALLPGLIRAVEHNWTVQQRDVRLFEIGRVFRQVECSVPAETQRIGVVLTGARHPPHWSASQGAPDLDLWDAKGMFEDVVRLMGVPGWVMGPDGDRWVVRDAAGVVRGAVAMLAGDAPRWAGPVVGLEVDLEVADAAPHRFEGLPVLPPADRDLALVLPAGVTAAAVEAVLARVGRPLLESARVFDEYRGEGMAGRSVAWRLVFRDPARTLRDEEVDMVVDRILVTLRDELGVERRQT